MSLAVEENLNETIYLRYYDDEKFFPKTYIICLENRKIKLVQVISIHNFTLKKVLNENEFIEEVIVHLTLEEISLFLKYVDVEGNLKTVIQNIVYKTKDDLNKKMLKLRNNIEEIERKLEE